MKGKSVNILLFLENNSNEIVLVFAEIYHFLFPEAQRLSLGSSCPYEAPSYLLGNHRDDALSLSRTLTLQL